MKPITTLFILFSLTLCLSFKPHHVVATRPAPSPTTVPTNLIAEACKFSGHKEECIASLQADPNSQKADLKQLAVIALRQASANATDTATYMKELLKNQTIDPVAQQTLTDCSEQFVDAIEQLDSSLSALLAAAYNDVNTWVKAGIADVESCEFGFKDNPDNTLNLSHRTRMFRQLSNNALAIIKALAGN